MADKRKMSMRMGKISMRDCLMWKTHVKKEMDAEYAWFKKYSWMMDIYREMEKQNSEMSKKSEFLKEVFIDENVDTRSIKPIPESVNHEYGWLANKKEFQNKISDFSSMKPLPTYYKLWIPYDTPHMER